MVLSPSGFQSFSIRTQLLLSPTLFPTGVEGWVSFLRRHHSGTSMKAGFGWEWLDDEGNRKYFLRKKLIQKFQRQAVASDQIRVDVAQNSSSGSMNIKDRLEKQFTGIIIGLHHWPAMEIECERRIKGDTWGLLC